MLAKKWSLCKPQPLNLLVFLPVPFCWLHFLPPPPVFPQLLPSFSTFALPIYYSSTHFLANQSPAAFIFGVCILYILSYCLWLPSVILLCVISLSFTSIHWCFRLVSAHTWLRILWLSNRCRETALEEGWWFGASEPRISLVSTCSGCPSPILFCLLFFLIYPSKTLQSVTVGWQVARASVVLK